MASGTTITTDDTSWEGMDSNGVLTATRHITIPAGNMKQIDLAESNLIPQIGDGSVLQLGIGAMPNVVGAMLAESDIRDLTMHTELCGDAYLRLYEAGKLAVVPEQLYFYWINPAGISKRPSNKTKYFLLR